ncbi:hypothetical protein XELAEV_18001253mg [Xenopus laevis]|nr:hypothetical protein XELAEV_18001253mg [Xenopus laevis]
MDPATYNNTGTWKKHAVMATIGVVTVILLIASTALLTIGYMNAFGNIGLGILGAGAVLYFGSVIFLCASCIWVKNKYYPDETEFTVKIPSASRDDRYLPKPVPNLPHSEMAASETREVSVPLFSGSPPIYSQTSTDTWLTDNDACFSSDAFLLTPLSVQHRISKPGSEQRLEMGTHFIYPSTLVKNQ